MSLITLQEAIDKASVVEKKLEKLVVLTGVHGVGCEERVLAEDVWSDFLDIQIHLLVLKKMNTPYKTPKD